MDIGFSSDFISNIGLSWDFLMHVSLSGNLIMNVGLSFDFSVEVRLGKGVDLTGVVVWVDGQNLLGSIGDWGSSGVGNGLGSIVEGIGSSGVVQGIG